MFLGMMRKKTSTSFPSFHMLKSACNKYAIVETMQKFNECYIQEILSIILVMNNELKNRQINSHVLNMIKLLYFHLKISSRLV